MNNIIFGTDGWRGLLDSELNEMNVSIVAQAFSDYIIERNAKTHPKIAIAYDGRRNSKLFADIFAEIASGNDIQVFLSEKIEPTPVLSYFIKNMNLSAGVMITASHNPSKYNGIKFKDYYGGPFFTENTLRIESLLNKTPIKKSFNNIIITDLRTPYLEKIKKSIDLQSVAKTGIRVCIDSMAGAGQQIIKSLFSEYNIESENIFSLAKEDFAGRLAEPIEKNLQLLSNNLSNGNFSIGVATDGDADRVGIMLEDGRWLSAQYTIFMIADYLINKKSFKGDLVKTASVTGKLNILAKSANIKIHDVQVGFKYICEKMIGETVAFGAEESGGFGYAMHIPERDGIYSSMIMCEMLANSGYNKLSDYFEDFKKRYGEIFYSRIDLEYLKNDRTERLPSLYKHLPLDLKGWRIADTLKYLSSRGAINGLKFILEGDSRWLLIRASETEPLIRIYAEGNDDAEVNDILSFGRNLFE